MAPWLVKLCCERQPYGTYGSSARCWALVPYVVKLLLLLLPLPGNCSPCMLIALDYALLCMPKKARV